MFVDPSGRIIATIAGAIIGGDVGGAFAAFRGDDFWTGVLAGAASGAIVGATADLIALSGGTGAVAILAMAGGGFIGEAVGSMITQVGNEWQWGMGSLCFRQSLRTICFRNVTRDGLYGLINGFFAGATGQLLHIGQQHSVGLYRFVLSQPNINSITFNAAGNAVIRSATNAFLFDAVSGLIFTIGLEGARELMSAGGSQAPVQVIDHRQPQPSRAGR